MRLDRTRITIVERSFPEIMDLAMVVLRSYPWQICTSIAVLAIPFALLNFWLVSWMTLDLLEPGPVMRYWFHQLLLVYLEAPFVSSIAVLYLGKMTFLDFPSWRPLLVELRRAWAPLLWTQGIWRGTLLALMLEFSVDVDESFSGTEVLLVLLSIIVLLVRSFRPYLPEIILLEKAPLPHWLRPWKKKDKNELTLPKRNKNLHDPDAYDLFSRSILFVPIVVLVSASILGGLWFVHGIVTNEYTFSPVLVHFIVPLVMWTMVVFTTVVRFFAYLDLRIRHEGWEVQLLLRAESYALSRRIRKITAILVGSALALCGPHRLLAEAEVHIEIGHKALKEVSPDWYDSTQDDLETSSVLSELSETADQPPPQRAQWERVRRDWTNSNFNLSWSFWGDFFQGLAWFLLIAIVVLLVYALIHTYLRLSPATSVSSPGGHDRDSILDQQRIEQLPVQLRSTKANFLEIARQHYQQGNYREAIIYLFSYRLLQLDKAGLIHLTKGKTNRQYLKELGARRDLKTLLAQTMAPFEDVFFGHHDLDEKRFEFCWA